MMFKLRDYQKQKKQDIAGSLKVVVNSIPEIQIDAEAKLKLNELEKNLTKELDVSFYGDVILDNQPITYDQAVEVYKKLPDYTKQSETPIAFSLSPINIWCHSVTRLLNEISDQATHDLEQMLDDFSKIDQTINSLKAMKLPTYFSSYNQILNYLEVEFTRFKGFINQKLTVLIPNIRRGSVDKKPLYDLIKQYQESHFEKEHLMEFLNMRRREIESMEYILSIGNANDKIIIVDKEDSGQANICMQQRMFSLIFFIRILPNTHISSQYLTNPNIGDWNEQDKWFNRNEAQGEISEILTPFETMAKNTNSDETCFIIRLERAVTETNNEISDKLIKNVQLQAWKGSKIVMEEFAIPSLVCPIQQLDSASDELKIRVRFQSHERANYTETILWNIDDEETMERDGFVWKSSLTDVKHEGTLSTAVLAVKDLTPNVHYGVSFALATDIASGPRSSPLTIRTSSSSKPEIIEGSMSGHCDPVDSHPQIPSRQGGQSSTKHLLNVLSIILFVVSFVKTDDPTRKRTQDQWYAHNRSP